MVSDEALIEMALSARESAYAPYSGFRVGAALLCTDGTVVTGCNVESAAYAPTICAERTAFVKAVSEGKREFVTIAVVGGKDDAPDAFCFPCGVCRQVMAEFCGENFRVLTTKNDETAARTLNELLPDRFGAADLR